MIIQCEKCQAKFRLDDSRITDRGVKVRCTKCKHVFTVQKEGQNTEPVPSQGSDVFDDAHGAENIISSVTSSFDASAIVFESDENRGEVSNTAPVVPDEPVAAGSYADFSGPDFGSGGSEPDSTYQSSLPEDDVNDTVIGSEQARSQNDASQGLDFYDQIFGTPDLAAPETSTGPVSFDFLGKSFADSIDMSDQGSGEKNSTLFSLDLPGVATLDPGKTDSGDELTGGAGHHATQVGLELAGEFAGLIVGVPIIAHGRAA